MGTFRLESPIPVVDVEKEVGFNMIAPRLEAIDGLGVEGLPARKVPLVEKDLLPPMLKAFVFSARPLSSLSGLTFRTQPTSERTSLRIARNFQQYQNGLTKEFMFRNV